MVVWRQGARSGSLVSRIHLVQCSLKQTGPVEEMHNYDSDKGGKHKQSGPGNPALQRDIRARDVSEWDHDQKKVPETEENQNSQDCVIHSKLLGNFFEWPQAALLIAC